MKSTHSFRVIFAILMAAFGIGHVMSTLPDMAKAQKAALSIMKLLRLDPRIDNLSEEGEKDWSEEGGRDSHIEFKTVTFRYPSRPKVKVLQGLSLKIPKGKTVAFVGPSGS